MAFMHLNEVYRLVVLRLQVLHDPLGDLEEMAAASGQKGCAYCGGLGHRISECPKLELQTRQEAHKKKDYFGAGGFGGEM